ncbi:hypothetical protein EDD18DRAFT_1166138, partial [Armillaria luteobubalina]
MSQLQDTRAETEAAFGWCALFFFPMIAIHLNVATAHPGIARAFLNNHEPITLKPLWQQRCGRGAWMEGTISMSDHSVIL